MVPTLPVLVAVVFVLVAAFEKKRCFAATNSSHLEVTVQVQASCEAAGLCGLADVHELDEPSHVVVGLVSATPASHAAASVAQLPASNEQTAGSRIVVHELNEPGHVPAILPRAPASLASETASGDRAVEVAF